MAFERAEALYMYRDKFHANYEKYCVIVPVLSVREKSDSNPEIVREKCEKVAYSAGLLAVLFDDRNLVCQAFSQDWWKTAKEVEDVRELELVVGQDGVTVSINQGHGDDPVTNPMASAVPEPTMHRRGGISLDSTLDTMKDIDVFQYTHNTEYYCDTPNDFMVLLKSMPAEKACNFQAYSFFLQEVKQGCDLSGILEKLKSICTSYLSLFLSFSIIDFITPIPYIVQVRFADTQFQTTCESRQSSCVVHLVRNT
jgi:hypothetical protein